MIHTHAHSHSIRNTTAERMALALVITLAFVVIEGAAGWLANSLALLTDAAHNFTDVIALGLSWYALRLLARRSDANKTYGYHRAGILIALVNSMTLAVIAAAILYEAVVRLRSPVPVQEQILIIVALFAFVVNVSTAWLVRQGSDHDLSQRSAYAHLSTDALATLGAFGAGIGIAVTGWEWLDPLVSVLIALLILVNVSGIVRETLNILLEATPRDVDMDAMVRDLQGVKGVRGVHDLHVWSLSQNVRALSAHLLADDVTISRGATIQLEVNEILAQKYNIGHATLQLECVGCEPDQLFCEVDLRHSRSKP